SNGPGAGTVTFRDGDGEGRARTIESVPVEAKALGYHPAEMKDLSDDEPASLPFRHEVRLAGLAPDTSYKYSVLQNGDKATGQFHTQGTKDCPVRFIVYADSETEPESTGKPAPWGGTANRSYLVDQTTGYCENLKVMARRNPDFVAIAGDLVQSGGEQRDWDEFWRQNSALASSIPIFPALGNHEYYGGPGELGHYGPAGSERAVQKYKAYFDLPANGATNKAHLERYYTVAYGPVSLVVLDLNNGYPHRSPRDTNWSLAGEGNDSAPAWHPGSPQYDWLEETLALAQKESTFTFVMFHDCPYSSGIHGLPPGVGSGRNNLSGVPVRALTPLFMKYGVDALLTGHDEMYEHSAVPGEELLPGGKLANHVLHVFDVGVGGDGLRGPFDGAVNGYRTFLAHADAPEVYDQNGILVDGGKHYGHLEVNVARNPEGRWQARMDMVYVFPVSGKDGHVSGFERRLYKDSTVLVERQ
ncbi:MAG: metallophosphoesterase, partial [Verrucomicrobiota bacterium]